MTLQWQFSFFWCEPTLQNNICHSRLLTSSRLQLALQQTLQQTLRRNIAQAIGNNECQKAVPLPCWSEGPLSSSRKPGVVNHHCDFQLRKEHMAGVALHLFTSRVQSCLLWKPLCELQWRESLVWRTDKYSHPAGGIAFGCSGQGLWQVQYWLEISYVDLTPAGMVLAVDNSTGWLWWRGWMGLFVMLSSTSVFRFVISPPPRPSKAPHLWIQWNSSDFIAVK